MYQGLQYLKIFQHSKTIFAWQSLLNFSTTSVTLIYPNLLHNSSEKSSHEAMSQQLANLDSKCQPFHQEIGTLSLPFDTHSPHILESIFNISLPNHRDLIPQIEIDQPSISYQHSNPFANPQLLDSPVSFILG